MIEEDNNPCWPANFLQTVHIFKDYLTKALVDVEIDAFSRY